MATKQKFKAAYLSSSLFKDIDREQLYSEQKHVWDHAQFEHFRYYTAMPGFEGKYISTDNNGFRNTVQYTKDKDLPLKNIAIFGTSTMWGGPSGGDQYTVPSLISEISNANSSQYNFRIHNFAVGAYTSTQELILFIELLENEIFDMAFFVDGASEFLKSFDELISNRPKKRFLMPDLRYVQFGIFNSGLIPSYASMGMRFKRSKLGKKIRATLDKYKPGHRSKLGSGNHITNEQNQKQVARTLGLYSKNMRIINAISADYNIKSFFILEPWIFTKKQVSPEEKIILEAARERKIFSDHITALIVSFSASFKTAENCYDLTEIINIAETIYIDEHHMSKKGNRIMAEYLSDIIIKNL